MSGYANLMMLAGLNGKIGKNEVIESLKKVGLEQSMKKKVAKYSLGMRQRLGIAQAIMENPSVLILDEPFVGLDPKASVVLKEMMHTLCDNGGAIFFSTHVLDVAEKLCNKVAIIKNGNLIASGKMEDIVAEGTSLESIFMEVVEDVKTN